MSLDAVTRAGDARDFWLIGVTAAKVPAPRNAPPHVRCPSGSLLALVSQAPAEVRQEILRTYAADWDVLPTPGTDRFESLEALRAFVAAQAPDLDRGLATIRGRVEFRARITVRPARVSLTERGVSRRRAAAIEHARKEIDARAAAALAGLVREIDRRAQRCHHGVDPYPACKLDSAILIERLQGAGLTESLARRAIALDGFGLSLDLQGPLPVVSFLDAPANSLAD